MIGIDRDTWTVSDALVFATAAHAAVGDVRKYTGEAYIVHPRQVHDVLVRVGITDVEMLAAALLHDVVEMTQVSYLMLYGMFGMGVSELVRELTPVSTKADGSRAQRQLIELEHLRTVSDRAQTIKLADIYSNCLTIAELDPEFAQVYLKEKADQIAVLTRGHPSLIALAKDVVGVEPSR